MAEQLLMLLFNFKPKTLNSDSLLPWLYMFRVLVRSGMESSMRGVLS